MNKSNPIPISNTRKWPLNLLNQPGRTPVNRLKPSPESANPLSRPLRTHPNWSYFLRDLNEMILTHSPALQEPFHELLDRSDQIY